MVRTETTVIGLGDSTCVGIGSQRGSFVDHVWRRLAERRPGARLANLCRSGATARDVVRDQLPRLPAGSGLVLLAIGANDVTAGTSDADFKRAFAALVDEVRRRDVVLVICNIPDASLAPAVPPPFRPVVHERIAAFNAVIDEVAQRRGLPLFDTYAMSRAVLPLHPEFFSADGYHPSEAGYRLWAEKLWPVVEKALGPAS